jgi:hypothetical protein
LHPLFPALSDFIRLGYFWRQALQPLDSVAIVSLRREYEESGNRPMDFVGSGIFHLIDTLTVQQALKVPHQQQRSPYNVRR